MLGSTGSDLASWLRTHGPLNSDEAVLFATGLADQLSALHAAGMVHGSLSATSIRVEPVDDRILAAAFDRALYQQVTGPTPADDVYGFGVVLRLLLDAAPVGHIARDGVVALPPAPPAALLVLLNQCLAADPVDRPGAQAVAQGLRSVGRDLLLGLSAAPAIAGLAVPLAAAPGYVPTTAQAAVSLPRRRPRSRRTLIVAATAVALVLAVSGGMVAIVGGHPADEALGTPTVPAVSAGAGTSTPSPSFGPTMPPRSDPIGPPYLMRGSEVAFNEASGHGCRAWMNGSDPGPYVEGVIESAGDDCEMALWRSRNGGRTFAVLSGTHRIRAGTDSTNYYWAGEIFLARVCLTDLTTGQSQCGAAFGNPSMPAGQ